MVVALQPGSVLYGGKYRILRLLGEGGMGSVFEAEHTVTHKRVAIKTMRPELANKPKAADRLVQEARASARNVSRSDMTLSYLIAWLNFGLARGETQALIGGQCMPKRQSTAD